MSTLISAFIAPLPSRSALLLTHPFNRSTLQPRPRSIFSRGRPPCPLASLPSPSAPPTTNVPNAVTDSDVHSPRSHQTPLHRFSHRLKTITVCLAASFLPFLPSRSHSLTLTPVSHSSQTSITSTSTSRISTAIATRSVSSSPHAHLAHVAIPPAKSPLSTLRVFLPSAADPLLHKVLKSALLTFFAISLITAITIAVFWIIQDSLVYKPTEVWRGNPSASGMPYYDDVNYTTSDGVNITGWFIRQPPQNFESARTLIYFHGTDKNASFRLRKVIGLYENCNCNILLLSYRGYGRSTGKPNERGFYIDADSAYKYLLSRGDVDVGPGGNLWVYGESLGGAVAIYFSVLYQDCINALILENTFTSLLDMIKLEFPILGIFRYLSRNRWQSKKRIPHLAIPLLFLSGLRDAYIPPRMMKQMHRLATKSIMKEFVEFEKGTHNGTWMLDGFYESVAQFMDRVDRKRMGMADESENMASSSRGIDDSGRYASV